MPFKNLTREARLRLLVRSAVRTVLAVVAIFLVYANVSFERDKLSLGGVGFLFIGLVLFVWLFVRQLGKIRVADYPTLRAVEAMMSILALFLVLFASTYLAMDVTKPSSFSEPLSHLTSMYFTITVFATVGFGDITPTADPTRTVAMVQMLLDLVFLGIAVRVLVNAARTTVAQRTGAPPPTLES